LFPIRSLDSICYKGTRDRPTLLVDIPNEKNGTNWGAAAEVQEPDPYDIFKFSSKMVHCEVVEPL